MARKWRRGINKITGLSTPLGGVQWEPATLDEDVAKAVLTFLEDRGVLFYNVALENPRHCVKSVLEIRHFLTEVMCAGRISLKLYSLLDEMRRACQRFVHPTRGYHPFNPITYPMNWIGRRLFFSDVLYDFREAISSPIRAMIEIYDLRPNGNVWWDIRWSRER
jgi:hypothetical protein